MLTIGGVAILLAFIYWRPQEIFEDLPPQTLIAIALLACIALILDKRVKAVRWRGSPLLVLLALFVGWSLFTVAVKAPGTLNAQFALFGIGTLTFVVTSQGLQNLRALTAVGVVFLCFSLAMAGLGVVQGFSPKTCFIKGATASRDGIIHDIPDDRPCADMTDCRKGGVLGEEYICEHPGPLGTHSIQGRVRYRGILEDPNEMSWALNMGMPFAFAIYERKRTAFRFLVAVAMVILGGMCVVLTASRSGQLGLLATLGVYFFRRFRWAGGALLGLLSVPVLIFGGRSGSEAEGSTDERLEAWSRALSLFREYPFTGVGAGQFREHHYLTAHNSFMLTLAELGPLGFLLWTGLLYMAFKITIRVQRHLAGNAEGAVARAWAMALLASLVGMVVSATFLSLSYHPLLWTVVGLVGALYGAVQSHDDAFVVKFGWRDLAALGAGDIAIVLGTLVYLRLKGF